MSDKKFISFSDVSFTYPPIKDDVDANGVQLEQKPVFEHFSAELPGEFITLIGPNASGKSTFMLLASGRIFPQKGSVSLFGKNTARLSEQIRGELASFIFQNMEFEQDDSVEVLLHQVFENGLHIKNGTDKTKKTNVLTDVNPLSDTSFLNEVISVFELKNILSHKLTGISKGEIQRVLLAFSVLYGSKSIFMDEPMFAMEERQKEASLEYLVAYSKKKNIPIYVSMHEIDLVKKYSPKVILFYPNRDLSFGTPKEVLTDKDLEKAYGVPVSYLKNYR